MAYSFSSKDEEIVKTCMKVQDVYKNRYNMYGQYYNTPEQWYRFKEDYKKGIYNDYL